tara:strand:- start:508 stop:723 length:216 start_codon:yes stop_codon:yes gene_type:complete
MHMIKRNFEEETKENRIGYSRYLLCNVEDKVQRLIDGKDVLEGVPWDVPEGVTNEQKLMIWVQYLKDGLVE